MLINLTDDHASHESEEKHGDEDEFLGDEVDGGIVAERDEERRHPVLQRARLHVRTNWGKPVDRGAARVTGARPAVHGTLLE